VFRSIPLRVKLVAAVLALVAAALVVISVGSAYFLRSFLTSRVDSELISYLGAVEQAAPETNPDGLRSDYLVAHIYPDDPYVYVNKDGRFRTADLPRDITSEAWYEQYAGREPFTVMSGSKGLRWRMVVAEVQPGTYAAVAQNLSDMDYAVDRLARINLVAGAGVLLVLAAAGAAIVRRSLRPLNEIERTAGAIAAGDLTRRVPDPEPGVTEPGSELGRLSRALNAMLAQIESAFAAREASETAARSAEQAARQSELRMRQFVADASHELRTPLTTIRGFAELHRQVTAAAGEESGRIVRRIEDEAARMGLLVEDLLLLARLDQERPLTLAPVDLRVLAADALHAVRVAAPGRDIRTSVEPGTGPLVVEGDDARLRQVLGNLLSNAVNHTPPSAAIAVALSSAGGEAVVEVRDTGPGLASDQLERVFLRFYRADPSRTRPDGSTSTGLGLAIVAALVAAHGGMVEVESKEGRGATFRIRIPLRPPAPAIGAAPDRADDDTDDTDGAR
jgi:two-component system OmpR family sensor kinase